MKLIVLCILVAYAAATGSHTDHDPFSEVPECRAVQEAGYDIPSCEGLSTCLREVHTKAHACTMKELKDKKMRTCHGTEEVKTARNAFFKYSCKWHAAFSKCMAGESPVGFSNRKRRTATHTPGQYFSGKHGECWKDVFAKVAQCKQIGQECDHYSVCAGDKLDEENTNDVQSTWFEITRDLRARKYEKMTEYKTKISTCVQNNQESSSEEN
jgi:hypothetical protein